MKPNEVADKIKKLVKVSPQQVALAKAFLLAHIFRDPEHAIQQFLREMEAIAPEKIVLHQSVDLQPIIKQAAKAISWQLAACEAVWGLISSNLLIPADHQVKSVRSRIRWATAATGSTYTDLPITDLSLPIPASVRRPYSTTEGQPLSDPDLFLHNLEIPGLHLEVEDSLREAVRCFRHELYLACLTMLGRASEGAWIELGLRLATAVERVSTTEARKIRNDLESPYVGVGKKVMQTLRVYERKDLEDIQKAARIRPEELRNAVIWADQVRDSRNSIHYGAKPATPNSYEKVAVLLIGAVPHLRLLYSIYGAVNTVASKKE